MQRVVAVLALSALVMCRPAGAESKVLVHLSKCGGPKVEAENVLVIDLTAEPNKKKALRKTLEERNLLAIRERTLTGGVTKEGTLHKLAKAAGKEHCDAVILMNAGKNPDAKPINFGNSSGSSGGFLVLSGAQIEVIFADPKPEPPPDSPPAEKAEEPPASGGGGY